MTGSSSSGSIQSNRAVILQHPNDLDDEALERRPMHFEEIPSLRVFYNPSGRGLRLFAMFIIFMISGFVGYITASESAQNIFQKFISVDEPEALPDVEPLSPLPPTFPSILDDNLVDIWTTVSSDHIRVEKPLPIPEKTPYEKDSDDIPFFWSDFQSKMVEDILSGCYNLVR